MDATLKQKVIKAHIKANYPHAEVELWNAADSSLTFYPAEELEKASDKWFPLCCYRDEESGKTIYGGREGILHTYTEGETGAGKTTRYAMQSIRALSSTKGKPSFLVVDIHGELVENLYDHLKACGYNIRILNCDNPSRSDTYNPFMPLVQRVLQEGQLSSEVLNQLRKIAEIMQPVEDTKDPIWDQGARSYANGLILDKFEDLLAGNIPPECITIYNIIESHYWLRKHFGSKDISLDIVPHFKSKPPRSLSVQKLIAVTNNADRTRACYMGVIENHFDAFGQPSLYQLSSSSTIDIEEFINEPTAIFIQSGTTSIGDALISLLTNEIYNAAVRIGRQSANKLLPRKIHCFLDEFANSNIADGPEFIRMLTTSRKFGMYWHMLLQSDAQLERKFDDNIGRIIRSNCTEIFMGSHDYATLERFAKSCGKRTVESLNSLIEGSNLSLDIVDMITADKLGLLQEGYIYVKTNRHPLLYSYIEAFYKCPEFKPKQDILSVYPVNDFDYASTVFFPGDHLPDVVDEDFRLLQMMHRYGKNVHLSYMQKVLPHVARPIHLKGLIKANVIRNEGQDWYSLTISQQSYNMLEKRYPDVESVPLPPEDYTPPLVNPTPEDLFDPEADALDFAADIPFPNPSRIDDLEKMFKKVPPFVAALETHFVDNNITEEQLEKVLKLTLFPQDVANELRKLRASGTADVNANILSDINLPFRMLESLLCKNKLGSVIRYRAAYRKERLAIKRANVFHPDFMNVLDEIGNAMRNITMETVRMIQSSNIDND